MTNALSEALQYITFFTFFLALAIDMELYDTTGGWSMLGVVSVGTNVIVLGITFRPGIKTMFKYRRGETCKGTYARVHAHATLTRSLARTLACHAHAFGAP